MDDTNTTTAEEFNELMTLMLEADKIRANVRELQQKAVQIETHAFRAAQRLPTAMYLCFSNREHFDFKDVEVDGVTQKVCEVCGLPPPPPPVEV